MNREVRKRRKRLGDRLGAGGGGGGKGGGELVLAVPVPVGGILDCTSSGVGGVKGMFEGGVTVEGGGVVEVIRVVGVWGMGGISAMVS